jgi:nickel transport protein
MNHTARGLGLMFALALLLFPGAEALAHRVNLFAYVDGGRIVTESWFSKSSRVRQGAIEVFDAATGEKFLSGTTDDRGNFAFDIPPAARDKKADLRIVLRAGEGHGNETEIKAAEYLNAPAAPGPASDASAPPAAQPAPAAPAAPPQAAADTQAPRAQAVSPPAVPDPALIATMDKLLDAKLAPVKSLLAESLDPAPSMTEIIGGVGWIFGLVGVAAYFKSRKR